MNKSILLGAVLLAVFCPGCAPKYEQPELGARQVEILTVGKYQFKDLNKNGTLDPYEDWRLPMQDRIADLVSRMTLEEKVGLMFHPNIAVNESGEVKYDLTPEEKEAFTKYLTDQINKTDIKLSEFDRFYMYTKMLQMYSNPLTNQLEALK